MKHHQKMFKLNVDCFEHLFEWLSLEELLTFRCTCNRMKLVVDFDLCYASADQTKQLICHAPKVQQIKIGITLNQETQVDRILGFTDLHTSDLVALNEERKSLSGARKVTI